MRFSGVIMNKNVAIVIVAVILLGMGLITYNEYASSDAPFGSPPPPTPNSAKNTEKTGEVLISSPDTKQEANTPSVPTSADPKSSDTAIINPVAKEEKEVIDPVILPKEAEPYKAELSPTQPEKTVVAETKLPPKKATEKVIKKITVANIGDGVTVRLDSSEMPSYNTIRLTSPERLVIDLNGTWKLRAPGVPKNPYVSNVRIGLHKDGTRIVIDLKKVPSAIRYLKYEEHGLDIRLR